MTPMRPGFRGRYFGYLAALLAAGKLLWLGIDATPMLFLGDSESYLAAAQGRWIPPDRSFLYGYVLQVAALLPRSLTPLLLLQTAASIVSALILAYALRRHFSTGIKIACGAAICWAMMEPLGVLFERYLMAEAIALPFLALFILCSLRYIETARAVWLLPTHAAATVFLALRYSFVPVAWLIALALPGFALLGRRHPGKVNSPPRALAFHLLVSLLAVYTLHTGFKNIYGELRNAPPAYQYSEGLFLLAAWAPLIEAKDFPDPLLGEKILASNDCPQADRQLRDAQRWYPGCLIARLSEATKSEELANLTAKRTAIAALLRDPLGVTALTLATWGDWFDRDILLRAMHWDRGEIEIPRNTQVELRRLFALDGSNLHRLATPSNRLFFASWPWIMLLAASPLLAWLFAASTAPHSRRMTAWLALLISAMVGLMMLAATKPVPRYMHPVAWILVLMLAAQLSRWHERAKGTEPLADLAGSEGGSAGSDSAAGLQGLSSKPIFRYLIVGAAAFVVDYTITAGSLHFLPLLVANTMGFAIANVANFLLGHYWVFDGKRGFRHIGRAYLAVLLVSLVGLAINDAMVWFCVVIGGLGLLAAKVVATLVVLFWNYFCRVLVVYRREKAI